MGIRTLMTSEIIASDPNEQPRKKSRPKKTIGNQDRRKILKKAKIRNLIGLSPFRSDFLKISFIKA